MKKLIVKKKFMGLVYQMILNVQMFFLWGVKEIGRLLSYQDMTLNTLLPYAEACEKTSDCYVTCCFRPKKAEGVLYGLLYESDVTNKIAIVLQGPVVKKNEFTYETVKLYQRLFPGVKIILSTWKGEDEKEIQKFRLLDNCEIVLNEKPEFPGRLNINYQTISSYEGIKYAQELGRKYVLKIRTDMRIYKGSILQELYYLLRQFPSSGNCKIQKERMIVFNAYAFRPYNWSDFYMFGLAEDLLQFWNTTYQECECGKGIANQMDAERWTFRKVFESHSAPEIEIPRDYAERVMNLGNCGIKEYWDVLRDYFIVLPHTYIDVLWYKYDYNREVNFIQGTNIRKIYGGNSEKMLAFSFGMWMQLLNGNMTSDVQMYEKWLDE